MKVFLWSDFVFALFFLFTWANYEKAQKSVQVKNVKFIIKLGNQQGNWPL